MRERPSTSSDVIAKLKAGERFVIVEKDTAEGWDKIIVDSQIGYISNQYVITEPQ